MKILQLLSLLIFASFVASCRSEEPDVPDVKPKDTSRTVLVYMVANNSLNSPAADDIASMKTAIADGALQDGRLLIYKVGYLSDPELIELTPDGTSVLKKYPGTTSSVEPSVMAQVISDMKSLAPAKDYGAIFWSHSTGWLSPVKKSSKGQRSWGDDNGKKMSIPDLANALKGCGLSFIYFDCCFMGNVETLYEIKDAAPYVVASPVEVPADGMPYETNLKHFFSEQPDLVAIARNTYEHYNALTGPDRSCVMSVYDMSALDRVAQAASDILAVNHTTPPDVEYQQYGFRTSWNNFADLFYDMGQYYTSLTDDSRLLGEFEAAMDDFIVYTAATPKMWGQWDLTHTSGASTFIYSESPAKAEAYGYDGLKWWDHVVKPYFE